jgi:hypothetical protein
MMEAASTCETSVIFYQTTRRNNPEDSHLLYLDKLQANLFLLVYNRFTVANNLCGFKSTRQLVYFPYNDVNF